MSSTNPMYPSVLPETPAEKPKKAWYKRWWVWLIAAVVLIAVIGGLAQAFGTDGEDTQPVATETDEPAPAEEDADSEPVEEEPAAPEPTEEEPEVPAEYQSALTKAASYSDMMHMSKAAIFDQLTSEYGEKFSEEAAQYAMDNLEADWNANALAKAKSYQEDMAMSPEAIRDQLVSEYGEQFTQEEADYAIQHLND